MLPGFRFFMATIVLAASILIFGLGAAALLRATHEEVAAAPSLRTMQPPLPLPPRQIASAPPTLAMLRIEIPTPAIEETPSATATAAPADAPTPAMTPAVTAAAPSEPAPAQEPAAAQTDATASADHKPVEAETAAPDPASAEPAKDAEATTDAAIAAAPVSETGLAPQPQAMAPVPDVTTPSSASAQSAPAQASAEPAAASPAPIAEGGGPVTPTQASSPAPMPPMPIAVGGDPVSPAPTAPPQTTTPEPTRVVAVTATGCEILPTAPGQSGPIAEMQATSQPVKDVSAPDDKTAKLDPAPTGTIPTPVARPPRIAKTIRKRPVIRHRHHAPRARVVRREVMRPQPQPDLFTILFGGGQPTPASQPAR